jgi:eukaryotic-like serine/threonine-protein kinase
VPDDTLPPRFEGARLAGAGGMGRVYEARDALTGERVAVKVLRADSFEVMRFEREARILAELSHPGIVRYVAHGATGSGERWLAMEWLDGEDLSARLKRRELDLEEALTLARLAGEALGEAHRVGVVHRDVKPGNLFLVGGDAARLKLVDFGIARAPRSPVALTRTGFMVGTPGYMAPEQIRGEKGIDARADVFALGCVLFRCLTGRPPFAAEDDVLGMLLKVTLEPAPRVREIRPELREEVDDLVDRMLRKPPGGRPADGAAVADEIARIQGGPRAASWRPPPPVGTSEERLRCVLVGVAPEGHEGAAPIEDDHEMGTLAAGFGGALHVLVDGSLVVTLSGGDEVEGSGGAAGDRAVRAARCALAFRARLPGVALGLFAERAARTSTARLAVEAPGPTPRGGAEIDRRAALLARGAGGGVLLDDAVAALLDARFEVRVESEPGAAPGVEPGGAYLVGERDHHEARRMLLGKPTACVGREAEIGRLLSYLDEAVAEATARAVLVTAPAGTGKSRLAHELIQRVRRERPGVEIWIGRGDPMSAGSPFAMLASALRHAAGAPAGEPPAKRRARLAARLGRHLGARLSGRELGQALAALGEIAGVARGEGGAEGEAAHRDPRLLGDQMLWAWISLVRAETEAAPLCLVLEDLHWGDAPSLGFVGAALRDLVERPLLVLALSRPEVHDAFPGLWADRALVEINLRPLSRRASEQLAREVLGEGATREVVEAIAARSGGNAFYVEELIRAVAEGRGDTWPESVLAMAEQRLDRLDPEARRVLRAASVFGATFQRGGVAALLGSAARAEDWLPELVEREVVERSREPRFSGEVAPRDATASGPRPPQETYAFRHALMRDAAYATLPEADRAAAHALAAAWLEQAGEGDALLLAGHHERGGAPDRALGFYRRAAEQALEGDDLTGAIARAERAVACGAAGEALGTLRVIEGEAHAWRGQVDQAERACVEAMALLPRGSASWCQAAGVAAVAHVQLGHLDRFMAVAQALFVAEPAPDAAEPFAMGTALVSAYLLSGGLYDFGRAFTARAEAVLGDALEGSPRARGWLTWADCVRVKYQTGDSWHHLRRADEGIACFAEAGDVRGSIRIRIERGIALRQLGLHARAEAAFGESLALSLRLGVRFMEASSRCQLALLWSARGQAEEARAALDRAFALYAAMGNTLALAAGRAMRATMALDAGQDPAAALADALAALEVIKLPPGRAAALGVAAAARLALGDAAGALAATEEGMRLLDTLGSIPEGEAALRLAHAQALAAAGRADEAKAVMATARHRLLARASVIDDEEVRRAFLEGVEVNRRTLVSPEVSPEASPEART